MGSHFPFRTFSLGTTAVLILGACANGSSGTPATGFGGGTFGGTGAVAPGGGVSGLPGGGLAGSLMGGNSGTTAGGQPNGGASGNPSAGGSTAGTTPGGGRPGGYHESGAWHGFAYTAVDADPAPNATITPADFATLLTDGPYCAQGVVPESEDYSSIAMIGFNVNQDSTEDAPKGTWQPADVTQGGVRVNVSNPGNSSVIRVQIQGLNGATDETDRWCSPLSQFDQDVVIPWEVFNTMCWDNSGDYYAGQPLSDALVFVPGNGPDSPAPGGDIDYSFCVNDIGPDGSGNGGSGGGGQTGPCTTSAVGQGTLSDRYGISYLQEGGQHAYIVQNNGWGSGFQSETLDFNSTSFTISNASGSASNGAPFSYPSIFIGSNSSGDTNAYSGLPRQVSAISSAPTCLSWSGGSGQFNTAYDVWFNTSNSSAGAAPTGGYLMVWYHKPTDYQPVSETGTSVASASIAGENWAVWYGLNGSLPVVSYVHTPGDIMSLSFDLKAFISDAVSRGYLQNSWYLTSVFAGFEIWSSGTGHRIESFSAAVN